MPKTLFLFQEQYMTPKFFELEGNYTRLHKIYINGFAEIPQYPEVSADERAQIDAEYTKCLDELCDLVYDNEGSYKVKFLEPNQPTKDWDYYVECGFIP